MSTMQSAYESQYAPIADQAAAQYGIPAGILKGVIMSESSWNPWASSGTGANGIAQFIGGTAQKYGVNQWDATSSIYGAAHYLSDLYGQNNGDWTAAISQYKGGNAAGTQRALDYATNRYGYTGDTGSTGGASGSASSSSGSGSGSWLDQIKSFLANSALGLIIGLAGAVLILGAIWGLLNKETGGGLVV